VQEEKDEHRPAQSSPRFIALDRDGTVNVEKDYLSRVDEVELLPQSAEGLRRLRSLGYGLIVVTNQSGIGRGLFGVDDVEKVHCRLRDLLRAEGVELDGIYICPHRPDDGCSCRKPLPGLLELAGLDLGFALSDAVVVGDKACDISLGRVVGARTFLVRTGYGRQTEADGEVLADHVVDDLVGVALVLEEQARIAGRRPNE
jgi:D-glycero-D-manno-heptose 1,7-bisphosphate phosphatase